MYAYIAPGSTIHWYITYQFHLTKCQWRDWRGKITLIDNFKAEGDWNEWVCHSVKSRNSQELFYFTASEDHTMTMRIYQEPLLFMKRQFWYNLNANYLPNQWRLVFPRIKSWNENKNTCNRRNVTIENIRTSTITEEVIQYKLDNSHREALEESLDSLLERTKYSIQCRSFILPSEALRW